MQILLFCFFGFCLRSMEQNFGIGDACWHRKMSGKANYNTHLVQYGDSRCLKAQWLGLHPRWSRQAITHSTQTHINRQCHSKQTGIIRNQPRCHYKFTANQATPGFQRNPLWSQVTARRKHRHVHTRPREIQIASAHQRKRSKTIGRVSLGVMSEVLLGWGWSVWSGWF